MTGLNRTVRRETKARWRDRNLIVILEPPDIITIKEKGRRGGFSLTINTIYQMAAEADVLRRKAERRKRRLKVKRGKL